MSDTPSILGLDGVRPIVEIGIGSTYTDTSIAQWDVAQWDTEPQAHWAANQPFWFDVTCNVMEVSTSMGRDRAIDQWAVGTATITCQNNDGWADYPNNIDERLANLTVLTIRPGRAIRVGVQVYGYAPAYLWAGYIDAANPSYEAEVGSVMTFECVCAKGDVGRTSVAKLATAVGSGETVTNRIARILNAASWPTYRRDLDTSGVAMVATTLGGKTVDLLNRAADSAGGQVIGDLGGDKQDPRLAYRGRDWFDYDQNDALDGTIGNFGFPGQPPHYTDELVPTEDPVDSGLYLLATTTDEDPDGSGLYQITGAGWYLAEDPLGSGLYEIVGNEITPGILADTCPSVWEMSYQRDDITTQVLVGRSGEPERIYPTPAQLADANFQAQTASQAGQALYGFETYQRGDLETLNNVDLDWLGERILTTRSWKFLPRVAAVTINASRHPETVQTLMKASPLKPARFRCQHAVDERIVFDRVMMVTAAEHTITPSSWSARISLDDAEPFLVSGTKPAHWDETDVALWDSATWADPL